jgi:hypothetical protein
VMMDWLRLFVLLFDRPLVGCCELVHRFLMLVGCLRAPVSRMSYVLLVPILDLRTAHGKSHRIWTNQVTRTRLNFTTIVVSSPGRKAQEDEAFAAFPA